MRQKDRQGLEGRREQGATANGHRVSFWGDKSIRELVVIFAQLSDYIKKSLNCTLKKM